MFPAKEQAISNNFDDTMTELIKKIAAVKGSFLIFWYVFLFNYHTRKFLAFLKRTYTSTCSKCSESDSCNYNDFLDILKKALNRINNFSVRTEQLHLPFFVKKFNLTTKESIEEMIEDLELVPLVKKALSEINLKNIKPTADWKAALKGHCEL